MELIEREQFLDLLRSRFKNIDEGGGHCVLICGEAGIGKSALVNAFLKEQKGKSKIFTGVCDSLFTPRPLAPVYDVLWQINKNNNLHTFSTENRSVIFSAFLQEITNQKEKVIIVFEDIHWADEATLDFIKFFVRRIAQLPCLFILTYRDNEIHSQHPLRNVLGHLPADYFNKIELVPLSKEIVHQLAVEKGFNGDELYTISGGNPFYVNEIISSYSLGVPENVKDSILSAFHRTAEKSRQVWELLSVIPSSFETKYLEKLEPLYANAIENCIDLKILIISDGRIQFKHELFRRTIESSLSPLKRISLHKKILDLLQESFESNNEIERIIHHAKNANEYDKVVHYAPLAAEKAASVGAHIEASKLYLSAIEYYQEHDKTTLILFYEAYAYECYLTNQIKEAIIYISKSLGLLKEIGDAEKIGNNLRFLSWLWWINDNLKKAEEFATQAIEVLETEPASKAKAMAYSNISLLKMFSDQLDESIYWGEKAIDLARELDDAAILSDALGNVGSSMIRVPSKKAEGQEKLVQSLAIALNNNYHEHAARAYTNLTYNGTIIKDNVLTIKYIDEGIRYCEENNLDLWVAYMMTVKAKLKLDTGNWKEAAEIAEMLTIENSTKIIKIFAGSVLATIRMRTGDIGGLVPLLLEIQEKAFETMELQRIIQALTACLEYEWLTNQHIIEEEALDRAIKMTEKMGNLYANSELGFWLFKARGRQLPLKEIFHGYAVDNQQKIRIAREFWKKAGYPYNEALLLFDGDIEDKKNALSILQGLGANAVLEKMKSAMRSAGIKSIPRGIRKSTQSNPLFLTDREMAVLQLLKEARKNKEIAAELFISAKTVDHHISSILFKLDVDSRSKAVNEAMRLQILK